METASQSEAAPLDRASVNEIASSLLRAPRNFVILLLFCLPVLSTTLDPVCRRVTRLNAFLQELEVGMGNVLEMGPNVADSGGAHLGVYRVRTQEGWMILKTRYEERDKVSMVIQQELAKKGLAPRLVGIIPGTELRNSADRFHKVDNEAVPHLMAQGELMEEIPDAWNPTHSPNATPAWAVNWNLEKILKRVNYIEQCLNEMHIKLADPQIGISRTGEVFLLDIDGATYSRSGTKNQLDWVTNTLLRKLGHLSNP